MATSPNIGLQDTVIQLHQFRNKKTPLIFLDLAASQTHSTTAASKF
jgi:hypothetical protein